MASKPKRSQYKRFGNAHTTHNEVQWYKTLWKCWVVLLPKYLHSRSIAYCYANTTGLRSM